MHSCMETARDAFDWNHVRAFLAAAEHGSYTAAARALGAAQPTVGRQIAALEAELGVPLFDRVGRGVALTPTGRELIEHVRAMSDAALRVSRVAAGQALAVEGAIRVTASEIVATYLLPPAVVAIRAQHPGVELEILASNAPQDLARRDADVAIRNFRPTEPELVARKIGERAAAFYAAPKYLRRLGRKPTPAALGDATFLGFDRGDAFRRGLAAIGLALGPERFPIVSASQHVQWALACEGAGIAIMLTDVGDAEPRVRRVLAELPTIPIPLWLVTHRDVHTSRRVRVVADLLARALGGRPPAR